MKLAFYFFTTLALLVSVKAATLDTRSPTEVNPRSVEVTDTLALKKSLNATTGAFADDSGPVAAIAMQFTLCTDIFFGGGCVAFVGDTGFCYNLPGDWNDRASSGIVDTGGVRCQFFEHAGCVGNYLLFSGAVDDFTQYGFNDVASSVVCFQ